MFYQLKKKASFWLSGVIFLLLAAVSSSALAINPKVGVWWSPSEPGRGFVFDGSGATLAMQAYTYDAAGQAQWYLVVGELTNQGANWSGTLQKYKGGQCLGCAYRQSQDNGNDGVITIVFTSDTAGVLTMPNGTRSNIEAFFPLGTYPTGASVTAANLAGTYQCAASGSGSANGTVIIDMNGSASLTFQDGATGAIYQGKTTLDANGVLNATTSGTLGSSSQGTATFFGTFTLLPGTTRAQGKGQWSSSLGTSGNWLCLGS